MDLNIYVTTESKNKEENTTCCQGYSNDNSCAAKSLSLQEPQPAEYSPLSKHEKWCSIINSFMALEQLVLIFPIGWSHLFSAGIVSPIAITATAESPALGRHFVFTIQP